MRPKALFVLGRCSTPPQNVTISALECVDLASEVYDIDVVYASTAGSVVDAQLRALIGMRANIIAVPVTRLRRCWLRLRSLGLGRPAAFWEGDAIAGQVLQLVTATNYAFIHCVMFGSVGGLLRWISQAGSVVISLPDPLSLVYAEALGLCSNPLERFKYAIVRRLYERAERNLLPLASAVHVVADRDALYLERHYGLTNVQCIPNLVPRHVLRVAKGVSAEDVPPEFDYVLLGPNGPGADWFWLSVWPEMKRLRRDISITVVGGARPSEERLTPAEGVRYLESVPNYSAMLLRHKIVLLSDQSGTGMTNRPLHALTLARAVVATPQSIRGVCLVSGVHCEVQESPRRFAERAIALLDDATARLQLGREGQAQILQHYAASIVVGRMMAVYRMVARGLAPASRL